MISALRLCLVYEQHGYEVSCVYVVVMVCLWVCPRRVSVVVVVQVSRVNPCVNGFVW